MGEIRNGVFYNTQPTRRRPRTNVNAMAGRAPIWLGILSIIAQERCDGTRICERLDISRQAFTTYKRDMELILGVVIVYHQYKKRVDENWGFYEVIDWGVIDRDRLLEHYRTTK